MIDILLVESAMNGASFEPFLRELGRLFSRSPDEMWTTYRRSRGFTELHDVLLRIDVQPPLEIYLDNAITQGNSYAILHARDLLGRTALDWAVEHGWVSAAETLIMHGADVNQSRGRGLSLLHIALAGPPSGELCTAFLKIVQMLLVNGADANAIDYDGWTPLHIAASWGFNAACDLLREHIGDEMLVGCLTYGCESAEQLAKNNREGVCLTKRMISNLL